LAARLIRKRGQDLGIVEAPNQQAAERATAEFFRLTDQQRAPLALCAMRH
jgi:hypothetical protein